MSRNIIIGDIHGCFDELLNLITTLQINYEKDKVFLTGDLVHKGPASAEVLEYVIKHPIQMVLGNHDDFFSNTLLGEQKAYPEFHEIMNRIKISKDKIKDWLQTIPLFIIEDKFILVHAGLDPKAHWLKEPFKQGLLNIRFWNTKKNESVFSTGHKGIKKEWKPWYDCFSKEILAEKKLIFGHWAKKNTQIVGEQNIIGLDTGCCYGGALSAYILEEQQLVQVPSKLKKQFDY